MPAKSAEPAEVLQQREEGGGHAHDPGASAQVAGVQEDKHVRWHPRRNLEETGWRYSARKFSIWKLDSMAEGGPAEGRGPIIFLVKKKKAVCCRSDPCRCQIPGFFCLVSNHDGATNAFPPKERGDRWHVHSALAESLDLQAGMHWGQMKVESRPFWACRRSILFFKVRALKNFLRLRSFSTSLISCGLVSIK